MIKDLKNICNPLVFENIFNSYAKDVKRFMYFKTKDMSLAEDIVQDTFVKLWEDCKKASYTTIKSFLFTIANNLFLNIIKHGKVVHRHQQGYVHENNNESPEFLYLEQEFLDALEKAIAVLPEKQRVVFLLSRIEKKKYKEIATQLNISVKAVEKRMHYALLTLKEKIGDI
ncbi:MAG: RNA polymerase sigma-70 factor [Polaribacter sp.]|nr:RNA polymerase sigma-70 factor [Polaribacter sp.]